jgi:hypothetical protein
MDAPVKPTHLLKLLHLVLPLLLCSLCVLLLLRCLLLQPSNSQSVSCSSSMQYPDAVLMLSQD